VVRLRDGGAGGCGSANHYVWNANILNIPYVSALIFPQVFRKKASPQI